MSPKVFAVRRSASGTWRRVATWIKQSEALILMYHRVSDAGPDPWSLSVSPQHFAEQLEVLRRWFRPIALRELQSRQSRRGGPRPVILTFDDGYADNALTALPLLRAQDIPATVFVATALLGKPGAFWWDELADLLLRPGRLPQTLKLTVRGREFRWTLGASAEYSEHAYTSHRRWQAMIKEPPTQRQAVYLSLWELMLALPDDERRRVLDALAVWSGADAKQAATHRVLSETELAWLGGDRLVEIGAHSVTHPVLTNLGIDAQRHEARESKRVLESLIEKPVDSFSYPYGRTCEPTRSVVRDAGFRRACGTRPRGVRPQGNPFDLPRISVRDCNGDLFARMLNAVVQ